MYSDLTTELKVHVNTQGVVKTIKGRPQKARCLIPRPPLTLPKFHNKACSASIIFCLPPLTGMTFHSFSASSQFRLRCPNNTHRKVVWENNTNNWNRSQFCLYWKSVPICPFHFLPVPMHPFDWSVDQYIYCATPDEKITPKINWMWS